ncbi:MAG: gliding motility-associated C-terminal domain-containing protein, partial [Bacteroidales bacterium]|nr:gliding motility-associated C-terminal domain-containing protein [Bacteroidales bacterium]
ICQHGSYTQYNFDVTGDFPGIYIYQQHLQTIHGCDSTIILNLTVFSVDTLIFRDSICLHEIYAQHDFNIVGNTSGVYTYRQHLQTVHGCDSIVTLILTVGDSLIVNPTVYENVCKANSSTIMLAPSGSFAPYRCLWNSGETTMQLHHTSFGTHSAVIADAVGCRAQYGVTFTPSTFTVNVVPVTAHCNQPDGSVTINATGGSGNYTINWGNIIQTDTIYTATKLYPGNYSVTVSDGICNIEIPFSIGNTSGPEACFIENYDNHNVIVPVTFTNCSERADFYLWDLGDGVNALDYNVTHTYNDFGTYLITLRATDEYNCMDSFSNTIKITDYSSCYFPNAFTPNGDELNPYFKPMCYSILPQNYHFEIFNRWGNKVFETSDFNSPGWDGTYKGKSVQTTEMFSWRITYRNESNVLKMEKGFVTVVL